MQIPAALGLFWLLACASSPTPLCVSASETSAAALTIALGRGKSCDQPVEVEEVLVRRASDKAILWRFRASGGVKLSTFTYGVVPADCTGDPPAEPLAPGVELSIDVEDVFGADGVLTVTPN